jgi:mono/diheme cytochrome c family protein
VEVRVKSVCVAAVVLVAAGAAAPARATVRIGQEAVSLRYPAAKCSYCHTFDRDHMRKRAVDAGLKVRALECAMCHGPNLRTGPRILNDRGAWLRARKRRLRASRVDAAWLADYNRKRPAAP